MMDPIETKVIDINAEAMGVSAQTLMENAGRAAAQEIDQAYGDLETKTAAIV